MTGSIGGVLYVTRESAQHIAELEHGITELEHDLAHEHVELCAYRRALAQIVRAASDAEFADATHICSAAAILQSLIASIEGAVPGPSHPGSPS